MGKVKSGTFWGVAPLIIIYLEIMVDNLCWNCPNWISLRLIYHLYSYYLVWKLCLGTVVPNVTMVVNGKSFCGVDPGGNSLGISPWSIRGLSWCREPHKSNLFLHKSAQECLVLASCGFLTCKKLNCVFQGLQKMRFTAKTLDFTGFLVGRICSSMYVYICIYMWIYTTDYLWYIKITSLICWKWWV